MRVHELVVAAGFLGASLCFWIGKRIKYWYMRLSVAGAAKDAQVQNDILLSDFTRNLVVVGRLAGNFTPILTSRRMCCLGAPIALLWRFRTAPATSPVVPSTPEPPKPTVTAKFYVDLFSTVFKAYQVEG